MQIFGLISLLLAVAIGATWMVSSMGGSQVGVEKPDGTMTKSTYEEAIDSANDVVNKLESRDDIDSSDNDKSVTASGKSITIYDGVSVPENTTVLNLSGRGLSGSLKAEVRFLSNLKELNLSNNNFTGLPAEVGRLSKLEVLNLSNNPFTGLPSELGNLKGLKLLDLRGTQYAKQDLDVIKLRLPSSVQILVD